MALIDRAFDVLNGISLGDTVGIFYSDASPNTSGLDSPEGSIALQVPPSGEPQLWKKFGSSSTAWKKLQTKTYTSTGIPTTNNDGVDTAGIGITFEPGDLWINTDTSTGFYVCFQNTTGSALWGQAGGAASFESSTANIKMDGTASVGELNTVPRADHVHPSDTSKQNAHAIGNLTTSTGLLVSGGTGAVIGSGTVLSLPQLLGPSDSPTFVDVTLSSMHRTVSALGTDTKMATGVPFGERGKFKVAFTYSAPNIVATISFVGANTSFSYYISGKKFTVTSTGLSAYTKSATAAEGTWYFYINQSTTDVNAPDVSLSQIPWTIYDPDVLLWNAYYNATATDITWVGEERHTAGRDIYNHARNHAQGAIYKSGLLFSQYNGLTAFSSNTDNNFGRAQAIVSSGSFYDEDIQNTISHTDASITSTTSSPATGWNLTVNQFLGFTALATTGTNATTIVFTTTRTLATGQAVTVMTGNTTTVRGTTTITTGGTSTSFTVSSVTGLASGDAIVIGARIPIYYISAVAGGVYTWRKLTSTDFLGVSGGVAITAATIASATCQYNNATAGGFATITANRYYPMYLIATNMTSEPVIAVLGQGQSTNATLATALGEAPFQFANVAGLSGLGIQEAVPFYRLTYHYNTGGAFTNTRIKVVDVTFLNLRVSTVSGTVIGSSPSTMAASQVTTDTTNFSNVLSTSDTTVQNALDTIDDHVHNTYWGGTDSGSTNAFVVTPSPAATAYTAGMVVRFKANSTNTGASTINVNALGTKTIKKNGLSDLVSNDIVSGQIVTLVYDGTYFQLQVVEGIVSYALVSDAEAATGFGNNLCYVVATDTLYRYIAAGSAYTDDNKYVLSTGSGGNTRWVGVAGRYIYTSTNVFYGFESSFSTSSGMYNTSFGTNSLYTNSAGGANVAVGHNALYSSNADSNTAVGKSAGSSTTGGYNTYIGNSSGTNATSGTGNTAVGFSAYSGASGPTYATGSSNVAIGYQAAQAASSVANSVFIGYRAAYSVTNSPGLLTIIGYQAGYSTTSGNSTTLIGGNAGYYLTTENFNTFIGAAAGFYVTAANNILIGYRSGYGASGQSTGIQNVAIGNYTLEDITTATENVVVGNNAGHDITTGSYNVLLGGTAGNALTTQSYNIAIGLSALYTNAADYNIAIGYKAGELNVSGTSLVYIGYTAGRYATGASNLYIGDCAGRGVSGQSTGIANIAIGATALYVYTTGHDNTAIGLQSLQSLTTGNYNTAIGANAGYGITTTNGNMLLGTYAGQYVDGNYNTYIGYQTGLGSSGASTGIGNVGIGFSAAAATTIGSYNISIGYLAASALQNMTDTIMIGRYAGGKSFGNDTGSIYMGAYSGQYCVGNAANVLIGYNILTAGVTNSSVIIGYNAYRGSQGTSEVTNITVNSATIANYVGDWYRFYSAYDPAAFTFDFWFDTTGSDSKPAGANGTVQTKINITGLTTVHQIATAIATAMNGMTYCGLQIFSSSSTTSPAIITAVRPGTVTDPVMTNASELSATVTTQGASAAYGVANVYIGYQAGYSTSYGYHNVYLGYQAGYSGTSADSGIAIGYNAGYANSTQTGSVFIGHSAGQYATGVSVTFVGYHAGMGVTGQSSGQANTFIGYNSGQAFTTAAHNTCIGANAGSNITTGQGNVLVGTGTSLYSASGSYNTILGGYANTGYPYLANTVASNVMIGYNAGYYSVSSLLNVFIGNESGYNALATSYNVFVGNYSGRNVTTSRNIAIGYQTYGGTSITVAYESTRVSCVADVSGSLAGKYFSFSSTTTTYWLWYQVSGSGTAPTPDAGQTLVQCNLTTNDTAISVATKTITAIQGISGTPVYAYPLTGSVYVYIVNKLAGNVTDAANGAGGLSPGFSFTYTQGSGTSTTATEGVALGHQALTAVTSGSSNTALGYRAGYTLTTGTNNIFVGHTADTTSTGLVNSIVIGYGATTATSNQIYVGNASTTSAIVKGIYGNTNGANSFVRIGSDGTLYQDNNPPTGGGTYAEEIFTATPAQTNFSLSNAPLAEASTWVFIDAAYSATDQYTISTTTLILGTGLAGGEKVVIKYIY